MISVLIPCYNAARWVASAIESALAQGDPAEVEVIVVDDGSTDDSLSIIRRHADRIRFETGPNRGGNAARTRLLELARGEWVQYLDADDELSPGKLRHTAEKIMSLGTDVPEVLVGRVVIVKPESPQDQSTPFEKSQAPNLDPWVALARWWLPQTGGPVWKREALQRVGGWKRDQPCCQEHRLYLQLLQSGARFMPIGGPPAIYRIWSQDTVCRRDPLMTRRERVKILAEAHDFLAAHGELTAERRLAINTARFEIVRHFWQHARPDGEVLFAAIRRSDPGFVPEGEAAPPRYRLAYRLGGIAFAEWLASTLRGSRTA